MIRLDAGGRHQARRAAVLLDEVTEGEGKVFQVLPEPRGDRVE